MTRHTVLSDVSCNALHDLIGVSHGVIRALKVKGLHTTTLLESPQ